MLIVTYFTAVSFIEILMSAPRRWWDYNTKTCSSYVKYRLMHLLVLHKFLTLLQCTEQTVQKYSLQFHVYTKFNKKIVTVTQMNCNALTFISSDLTQV
jgi:hypothetical protein